jgi:hypothetical protein
MKISIFVFITLFISLSIIHSVSTHREKRAIKWNGNNWAFSCDFYNNDLTNVQVSGANCGGTCAQTSGCTHFTWTQYNGGTCWMKYGSISQYDGVCL